MFENFDYIINIVQNLSDETSDTLNFEQSNTQKETSPIINSNSIMSPDKDSDDSDFEKIIKILLVIVILISGGILLYYIYIVYISDEIPPIFSLEIALEQLKLLLSKERYDQLSAVIYEMENKPDKIKAGIQLLHIIKLLLKTNIPEGKQENFEKIINKIIDYFEKEE